MLSREIPEESTTSAAQWQEKAVLTIAPADGVSGYEIEWSAWVRADEGPCGVSVRLIGPAGRSAAAMEVISHHAGPVEWHQVNGGCSVSAGAAVGDWTLQWRSQLGNAVKIKDALIVATPVDIAGEDESVQ